MNILSKILKYSLHSLFLIVGLFLIFYGVVYLKILGETETILKEKVVVRFSSETEYNVDKPFWWILEGQNSVLIKNESDETHRGELVLKVQSNPCLIPVDFYFEEDKDFSNRLKFTNLNQKNDISISFELPPSSDKTYLLMVNMSKSCKLSNGDTRLLALKVVDFKFE